MPGRRGLRPWVSRLSLGLTGRLGLRMLLGTGLGLVVWWSGRMPRFRQGLRHGLGLGSGRSLLGVLRFLGGDLRHSLGLDFRPGLAGGC